MQKITVLLKDYQNAINSLAEKIEKEADFTSKLEVERKKFAKEMSEHLDYDMQELDDIFNEMETQVISSGVRWSSAIVNFGMIVVILFSMLLWFKMRNYETKNS